ncbi:hypothetical protein ALO_03841 [Acetonema longum DSM 6540]|uniref:Uncharacterized protein n=1 Tax=Acetonema longum DSM 6540 TaxID=1009370 RepID=F7NFE1_9FIRM|nr:hypothetical protein ALO_03841 [Acetonema longum DSM 6540]
MIKSLDSFCILLPGQSAGEESRNNAGDQYMRK